MKQESYQKYESGIKKAIDTVLASEAMKKFFATTKDAGDKSGTFRIIISTDNVDRQGESVEQGGLDFSHYAKNPIVLWAHDYGSLPIGMCTKWTIENGQTIAEGIFAPAEANPFAQQVRAMYDLGMISTASIGFIPTDYDFSNADGSVKITRAEVLEFSFVPVPANPYAIAMRKYDEAAKKGFIIDLNLMKTKGMNIKIVKEIDEKKATVGGSCTLDDGTAGIFSHDPKDPKAPLVCVPEESKEGKAAKEMKANEPQDQDDQTAISTLHDELKSEQAEHKGNLVGATAKMIEKFKGIEEAHASSKESADEKAKKPKKDEADDEHAPMEKAIEEYKGAMKEMQDDHEKEHGRHSDAVTKAVEKCYKAIEENHAADHDDKKSVAALMKRFSSIEATVKKLTDENGRTDIQVVDGKITKVDTSEMTKFLFMKSLMKDMSTIVNDSLSEVNNRRKESKA